MSESTTTSKKAVVPSSHLIAVHDAKDVADAVDLSEADATKVLRATESRKAIGDVHDVIVVMDGWAYQEWSDYEVTNEQVLLAGGIEDYSEDAYRAERTFEILLSDISNKSPEEVDEMYLNNMLREVDETDEEFHDTTGETFLPKSAVSALLVYESDE